MEGIAFCRVRRYLLNACGQHTGVVAWFNRGCVVIIAVRAYHPAVHLPGNCVIIRRRGYTEYFTCFILPGEYQLCLLATAVIGTTLAYFTDTKEVTNTFSSGNVTITLDEAPVGPDGQATTGNRVTTNDYKLYPGKEYDKDPTITVAAGSEDCYLFVRVVNGLADLEAAGDTTIAKQMENNGWKDSQLNSGETPNYETENFVKADWKHDGLTYTKENMTGEEPTLTYTYDPVEKALTEETPVKVAVMIDNCDVTTDTFFLHDECTFDNCKWKTEYEGDGYHFVVHLDTFDLTIKKSGCNETLDPHQTFVFTVTGPNGFSMEVVIEGNGSTTITNLPAGDYTVTEDTGWSWRYEPVGGDTLSVTAQDILNGEASVEFVKGCLISFY